MQGTIHHYKADRAYGFIRMPGHPEDIFFNAAFDFEGDWSLLKKGTPVEFEFRTFRGKQIAGNVRIVSAPTIGGLDENQ